MRLYETGFLVSPTLTEEEADAVIQQMADVVSQKNGKMIKQEKWGKRKMAYPIKKFGDAYYVFFHYEGGPEIPQELGRRFRQMDTILRYLNLNKETQANVRKKKKAEKKSRAREAAVGDETAEGLSGKGESPAAADKKREEE
jgi:small subunit ribosomal protein S6